MPLYDYECSQCHKITEVRHGFDEPYTERCPHCGAELRRLFNPASIVFKGSGFYITDSRKASETKSTGPKSAEPKSTEPKSAEPKSAEAKPAESKSESKASESSPSSSKESAA